MSQVWDTVNSYSWWWTLCFPSFALQDWNQDSGHHLKGLHPIYSFYIPWFIYSISPFFGLGIYFFIERKSEWSCVYGSRFSRNSHEGTDQQIIFTNLSENWQHERQAWATLVLIFIGQCCCEFLRFLDIFYSHLQRSVNLQSQRSTGSFLNPKKEVC